MKILVHPDSVPMTLEECIDNIKTYLDKTDEKEIESFKKNPFAKEKIGAAVFLKSAWTLIDKDNRLVQWFKTEYGIIHPDDISAMILNCLYCDVKGLPRKEGEMAEKYRKLRDKKPSLIKKKNKVVEIEPKIEPDQDDTPEV